ncbi:MAG: cyanophycin synthetase, partial [Elusimicrobiota bacterium]
NQNKNTLKILRQSISGKNIPCFLYGRDFYAVKEFVDWRNSYQQFSFYQRNSSIKKLCTQLIGKHQIENAATAIQASLILKESGFNVSRDDIKDGISNAYWPGRFEYRNVTICGRKIKIIFDGAHNPDGIKSLKSTLLESKYSQGRKKFNFVFSVMKEKNYGEMIKIISPLINKIFLYRIKNKRALSINNLRKVLIRYVNPGDIVSVKSIKNILNKAEKDILLVITGSIYLVGEFLKSPTPFTKGGNH